MKAYINYPNPHITIHSNDSCKDFQKQGKEGQRIVVVTEENIGTVLHEFIAGQYAFSADATTNDMWLDISLSTNRHSEGLVFTLHALLARKYAPLKNADINFHSCALKSH